MKGTSGVEERKCRRVAAVRLGSERAHSEQQQLRWILPVIIFLFRLNK